MEIRHCRIDLAACEAAQIPFNAIITREPSERWVVSNDAIRMDQPIRWMQYATGEHVIIPLVPYLMRPEPDLALAFMLQLGMRCSFDVGRPVRQLYVATGVPVNDVIDPQHGRMWQYYIGFALVLEP